MHSPHVPEQMNTIDLYTMGHMLDVCKRVSSRRCNKKQTDKQLIHDANEQPTDAMLCLNRTSDPEEAGDDSCFIVGQARRHKSVVRPIERLQIMQFMNIQRLYDAMNLAYIRPATIRCASEINHPL